jgi:hypothetical protein
MVFNGRNGCKRVLYLPPARSGYPGVSDKAPNTPWPQNGTIVVRPSAVESKA